MPNYMTEIPLRGSKPKKIETGPFRSRHAVESTFGFDSNGATVTGAALGVTASQTVNSGAALSIALNGRLLGHLRWHGLENTSKSKVFRVESGDIVDGLNVVTMTYEPSGFHFMQNAECIIKSLKCRIRSSTRNGGSKPNAGARKQTVGGPGALARAWSEVSGVAKTAIYIVVAVAAAACAVKVLSGTGLIDTMKSVYKARNT